MASVVPGIIAAFVALRLACYSPAFANRTLSNGTPLAHFYLYLFLCSHSYSAFEFYSEQRTEQGTDPRKETQSDIKVQTAEL